MLEEPVYMEVFIKFKDRHSKLKMMDTALYLFGMKLYRQKESIEFFDADFLNIIYVKSDDFVDKSLS